MIISNITPPQVWSASSRSLTNFGSSALAPSDTINTTLAAAGSVDLRSSAGIVGHMTIAVLTGAAATGSISIQLIDGVNPKTLVNTAAAASSIAAFSAITTNSVGPRLLNNDAAQAGSYMISAFVLTI